MGQVELAHAWVLAPGNDIVPIPGTKRLKCLDETWSRWRWDRGPRRGRQRGTGWAVVTLPPRQ